MGDIKFRFYFLDGDRIMRIGLDAKSFPKPAGKQLIHITITLEKNTKELLSIRFDPANIDPDGSLNCDLERKWAAATMNKLFRKVLGKEESDKVTSLRPRLSRIKLILEIPEFISECAIGNPHDGAGEKRKPGWVGQNPPESALPSRLL